MHFSKETNSVTLIAGYVIKIRKETRIIEYYLTARNKKVKNLNH